MPDQAAERYGLVSISIKLDAVQKRGKQLLARQYARVVNLLRHGASARRRRLTGNYNAVGSPHQLSTVLIAAASVAGHTGELISADDDWLIAHNVSYWAGPRSLPLSDSAFAQDRYGRLTE